MDKNLRINWKYFLTGDYLRFQQHQAAATAAAFNIVNVPPPPVVVDTTTAVMSGGGGRFVMQRPLPPASIGVEEAFESITPPSSPEQNGGGKLKPGNRHIPSSVPATDANSGLAPTGPPHVALPPVSSASNPVAAFPFSALAINVGGSPRPNSRSSASGGSMGQSPGDHERSPRSDFEGVVSGKSNLMKPIKRKRGANDSGEASHHKRANHYHKQSYRRSGSQSSSNSTISKSPDNVGRNTKDKRL